MSPFLSNFQKAQLTGKNYEKIHIVCNMLYLETVDTEKPSRKTSCAVYCGEIDEKWRLPRLRWTKARLSSRRYPPLANRKVQIKRCH